MAVKILGFVRNEIYLDLRFLKIALSALVPKAEDALARIREVCSYTAGVPVYSIDIDTNFSGSTCSSVLLTHDGFFTSNVGDSRSIKGTYLNSKWNFEQLSRDHKATETDEANRVIRFGGRIEPFKEKDGTYAGPKRVWLKKEQIPGLAMTRSFGDQVASSVGVVCEPEIRNFFWKEEDKFIVIASDGLWEYVSNKEVVDIVGRYYAGRTDRSI